MIVLTNTSQIHINFESGVAICGDKFMSVINTKVCEYLR